jgi:hypothetical protein
LTVCRDFREITQEYRTVITVALALWSEGRIGFWRLGACFSVWYQPQPAGAHQKGSTEVKGIEAHGKSATASRRDLAGALLSGLARD